MSGMKITTKLTRDSDNSEPGDVEITRSGESVQFEISGYSRPRVIAIDVDELDAVINMLFPERK